MLCCMLNVYNLFKRIFSEESSVGLCEQMVLNPSLGCVGSEFQTTGAVTWKLRQPVELSWSEEQTCCVAQLNGDASDQRCWQPAHRRG